MGRTIKIYIAVIAGLILMISLMDMFRAKPVNWTQSYSLDSKNPYDLYVFNAEIKRFYPGKKMKREALSPYEYLSDHPGKANYLIVAKEMISLGDSILLGKVAAGSNLFISSENVFKKITDTLHVEYENIDPDQVLDKPQTNYLKLSLTNSGWGKRHYRLSPVNNNFSFVNLNPKTATILGIQIKPDGSVSPNFVRIRYGKGFVYLHNQPQVFTNMALLENNGSADYVANMLGYLPAELPLVWFVKGQTSHYDDDSYEQKTSLSIIFQYRELRAAWLIFIYGLLLFVLFRIKRRQRVVPVAEPLKNTTVEFVQTIANLYFQEENATEIVNMKILFFLDKIRSRYYLDTSKLDEQFAERLQLKSGKDRKLIDDILLYIFQFKRLKSAVHSDLIRLDELMDEFWKR